MKKSDYSPVMPVRPDDVLTAEEQRLNEDIDRIITALNPQLTQGLESGIGRTSSMRCFLSADLLDNVRDFPAVTAGVIERLEEAGWVVYMASIRQWDLCAQDSSAGKALKELVDRASGNL